MEGGDSKKEIQEEEERKRDGLRKEMKFKPSVQLESSG